MMAFIRITGSSGKSNKLDKLLHQYSVDSEDTAAKPDNYLEAADMGLTEEYVKMLITDDSNKDLVPHLTSQDSNVESSGSSLSGEPSTSASSNLAFRSFSVTNDLADVFPLMVELVPEGQKGFSVQDVSSECYG